MPIWAGAISATYTTDIPANLGGAQHIVKACTIRAKTFDKARAKMERLCHREFADTRHSNHRVSVLQVPPDWIAAENSDSD